jgi:predicted SAM-dependent methyltransferase
MGAAVSRRRLERWQHRDRAIIICTHVLHIIADLDTAIWELYRILKPGGVLLVAVPQATRDFMSYGGLHRKGWL